MRRNREAGSSQSSSTVGTLFLLVVGPVIWALHLGAVYGYQSVVCAASVRLPVGEASISSVVIAVTIVALGLLGAFVVSLVPVESALGAASRDPEQRSSQRRIAVGIAFLSGFGVAGAGAAVAFLDVCAHMT